MLLELGDSNVTLVDLLVFRQFDKVIVPLPYGHRILLKEAISQHFHGVRLTCILLRILPESIVPPERWDPAGCADAGSSQHHYLFASKHTLGSLLGRTYLRSALILFRVLEATTE